MTELKSIWHKHSEKPTENKTIFAQHKSLRDDSIDCFMWKTQEITNAILKDIIAWCYLDDLLALETELDRTRKALDVAVDALGYYASENSWDETNRWMFVENGFEFARDVLVKIDKTLEQKE